MEYAIGIHPACDEELATLLVKLSQGLMQPLEVLLVEPRIDDPPRCVITDDKYSLREEMGFVLKSPGVRHPDRSNVDKLSQSSFKLMIRQCWLLSIRD